MNELAITLKKLRESKNMTIKELSEKANVGNGTIGDIETGRSKSSIKTLEKLSKAMLLNAEERNLLFASVIPNDVSINLVFTNREKAQLEQVMSTAQHFFNDEMVSEEDKKKLSDSLLELFFDSKNKNKRNK